MNWTPLDCSCQQAFFSNFLSLIHLIVPLQKTYLKFYLRRIIESAYEQDFPSFCSWRKGFWWKVNLNFSSFFCSGSLRMFSTTQFYCFAEKCLRKPSRLNALLRWAGEFVTWISLLLQALNLFSFNCDAVKWIIAQEPQLKCDSIVCCLEFIALSTSARVWV